MRCVVRITFSLSSLRSAFRTARSEISQCSAIVLTFGKMRGQCSTRRSATALAQSPIPRIAQTASRTSLNSFVGVDESKSETPLLKVSTARRGSTSLYVRCYVGCVSQRQRHDGPPDACTF